MSNTPQTNLSPAAAAVRAAYSEGCYLLMPHRKHQLDGMACPGLAAALRAAADQVVPHIEEPDWGACNYMKCDIELYTDHQRKRAQLLTIAAELEAAQ